MTGQVIHCLYFILNNIEIVLIKSHILDKGKFFAAFIQKCYLV